MSGSRDPRKVPLGCRWCGKPDPLMQRGLCRGCVRKKAEDAGRAQAAEISERPKPPPVDVFSEPEPPPDLFDGCPDPGQKQG